MTPAEYVGAVGLGVHRETLLAADRAFRVMRFDRPGEAVVLRELSAAWAAYLPAYERLVRGGCGPGDADLVGRLRRSVLELAESGAAEGVPAALSVVDGQESWGAADASPTRAWPLVSRPASGVWSRPRPPHNLPWLAADPPTIAEPFELFVWTGVPPDQLAGHGLATADLYLLARLGWQRLVAGQRSGYVLRLSVPGGVAVDLSSYPGPLPVRLGRRLREAPDSFLLPVAWLADVGVVAGYELDRAGGVGASRPVAGAGLSVCFRGADHGVPGLPNDVVRWPRRAHDEAYLTVPDDPDGIGARLHAHPGWLPVDRRRPAVPPGYHLLRLELAQRRAIDIRPTVAVVEACQVSTAGLSVFTGVDLALPAREFANTTITKVHSDDHRRALDSSLVGRSLAAVLPQPAA